MVYTGGEVIKMSKQQKVKVVLTDEEYLLVVYLLSEYRNKLISEGKYTDLVNEVLLKLCK